MSDTKDPNRQSIRLHMGAKYFHQTGALIYQAYPDANTRPWATLLVNLSFAIELGLKSYVREVRVHASEEEADKFQRCLGHSLVKALDACIDLGFQPSEDYRPLLHLLTDANEKMNLRYLTDHPSIALLPSQEQIFHASAVILNDVRVQSGMGHSLR